MKTILVADDFASVRLYHMNLLRQMGHGVVAAVDGLDALEKLSQHPVDLVLLDMLMPRMDGCEFLRRIRAMPQYASLPVLVITSEGDREHEQRFREAGANAFLAKPTLPGAMEHALRQLIS